MSSPPPIKPRPRSKYTRAEDELRRQTGGLLGAQDDEYRRIARELHDSTAQQLAALLTNLDLLDGHATITPPGRRLLADSIELLEKCADSVRSLSYQLHPPFLEEFGLGATLPTFVEYFTRRTGFRVGLAFPRDLARFHPTSELGIYRVVQESVSYVQRHSTGKTADVLLAIDGEGLVLEVRSRGRGIAVRIPSAQADLGLAALDARVRKLEGNLTVDLTRGGAQIRAIFPGALGGAVPRRAPSAARRS